MASPGQALGHYRDQIDVSQHRGLRGDGATRAIAASHPHAELGLSNARRLTNLAHAEKKPAWDRHPPAHVRAVLGICSMSMAKGASLSEIWRGPGPNVGSEQERVGAPHGSGPARRETADDFAKRARWPSTIVFDGPRWMWVLTAAHAGRTWRPDLPRTKGIEQRSATVAFGFGDQTWRVLSSCRARSS